MLNVIMLNVDVLSVVCVECSGDQTFKDHYLGRGHVITILISTFRVILCSYGTLIFIKSVRFPEECLIHFLSNNIIKINKKYWKFNVQWRLHSGRTFTSSLRCQGFETSGLCYKDIVRKLSFSQTVAYPNIRAKHQADREKPH